MLHKHDDDAVDGWDPGSHPRSELSGRTNDEVRDDPDRRWRSGLPASRAAGLPKPDRAAPARNDDLDTLETLGWSGTWPVFGRELRVTNLGKELFPPSQGNSR